VVMFVIALAATAWSSRAIISRLRSGRNGSAAAVLGLGTLGMLAVGSIAGRLTDTGPIWMVAGWFVATVVIVAVRHLLPVSVRTPGSPIHQSMPRHKFEGHDLVLPPDGPWPFVRNPASGVRMGRNDALHFLASLLDDHFHHASSRLLQRGWNLASGADSMAGLLAPFAKVASAEGDSVAIASLPVHVQIAVGFIALEQLELANGPADASGDDIRRAISAAEIDDQIRQELQNDDGDRN
jgi:hypothetical protein